MCGIAGYFNTGSKERPDWRERLQRASTQMALRGPDGDGIYHAPGVGLAHRRLAIIDLQGGQQPMTDPATRATIVFNGEIYNYKALQNELKACGHTFFTDSDTDVLLHAYIQWGAGCLDRLVGMFAFAIHDPRDNSLFLARDRLGVKPLFWSQKNGTVCFASSVSALLPLLGDTPGLNPAAISHYLTTVRVNLGAQTLLEGVELLEPGHWMRVVPTAAPLIKQYWQPTCPDAGQKTQQAIETCASTLQTLMHDAVEHRLISDVPLGGFLSGGIDSTIIAALASPLSGNNYHAYNVGYPEPGFNEFSFVTEAANAYQMRCRQIALDARDYPRDWEWLIRRNGLPLSTPNEVPILMLARALKQEYTVALSGEGADEIFGGYTIAHFAGFDFDRASRTAVEHPGLIDQAIQRAYGQQHLPDLATQHLILNTWLNREERQAWLHPDFTANEQPEAAVEAYYRALYAQYPRASTMDRIMLAHLRINLEGLLLRVDSSSMAASVETRVPFTDHRLVDFAFTLPDSLRLDWRSAAARRAGETLNVMDIHSQDLLASKRLLRHAYASHVPASILNRPKMSFPVPVFEWMQGWMQPMIREIIASSPLRGSLLNADTIDRWLSGRVAIHPMKIWPIVNLCLWHASLTQP